jgi:hypothetical protein
MQISRRKIEYINGKLQFYAKNMTALVQNQTKKISFFGPFRINLPKIRSTQAFSALFVFRALNFGPFATLV